jgi:predicted helicase
MRQSLINSFSDIYILDLHGDIRAREVTPEGDKDQNVFDQIQTGVSICVAIKEPGKNGPARVHHHDLWGARKGKDAWLAEESLETTEWNALYPQTPSYYFVPRERDLAMEYEQLPSITEVFGTSTLGFKTHRDQFAVSFDKVTIEKRINDLRDSTMADQEIKNQYKISSTRDWNLSEARSSVRTDSDWKQKFTHCLFRPFDQRYCYLSEAAMDWPRPDLISHALQPNLMLVVGRQGQAVGPDEWQVISVTQYPADTNLFRRGGNQVFPLYLYPQNDNLFDAAEEGRRPNLSPEFVAELSEKLGLAFVSDGRGDLENTFGPEDVFYYAYAVFHSPEYRERYAEFLKRDFPRLPLTSDKSLFAALAEKGAELVGLHLMTSPALEAFVTRFPEGGTNEVEKVRYAEADGRVHINNEQYFEGVPEEVWEFRVGGYQVLDKWLKDRKGRTLSYDDIRHYQKIVVALSQTRRLMAEIDETIPGWPLS